MIVLFQGGPIDGEMANILPNTQKEIRVGALDETVALYHVGDTSKEIGFTLAVAHYSGEIESALTLVHLFEENFHGE